MAENWSSDTEGEQFVVLVRPDVQLFVWLNVQDQVPSSDDYGSCTVPEFFPAIFNIFFSRSFALTTEEKNWVWKSWSEYQIEFFSPFSLDTLGIWKTLVVDLAT